MIIVWALLLLTLGTLGYLAIILGVTWRRELLITGLLAYLALGLGLMVYVWRVDQAARQTAAKVNELTHSGGEKLSVAALAGDKLALTFANQVKSSFEKMGWEVGAVTELRAITPAWGMVILQRDAANGE